jgi:transposase-like protein
MMPSNSTDIDPVESNDIVAIPAGEISAGVGDDSPESPLTLKQQQALEWLMSGGSITEAAELVGVARQTVSRWINHHFEFTRLYQQWQEQIRTAAESRLLTLADAAVDNLMTAVQQSRDVRASQFVLKLLGIASRKGP